jgi:uncharacterized membrane protein YeiH
MIVLSQHSQHFSGGIWSSYISRVSNNATLHQRIGSSSCRRTSYHVSSRMTNTTTVPFLRFQSNHWRQCELLHPKRRHQNQQPQQQQSRSRRSITLPTTGIPDPNLQYLKNVEIARMVEKLDVRLTDTELRLLQKYLDRNGDGFVSKAELAYAGHKARMDRSARELALSVVEQPESKLDHLGQAVVRIFDFAGTALFSVVSTLAAGDAGMNMIGCCLVGCVGALGGGTINHVFYGGTILGKSSSVFWCRDWRYLAVAAGASLLTFFVWPLYVTREAEHYLQNVFDEDNLDDNGACGREEFVKACHRDHKLLATCRAAFPFARPAIPQHYFDLLDTDHTNSINHDKLRALVQKSFENSPESYVLETAALAAFTVSAVHGAIGLGLHPLIAATSGVTMCFGGIFRDLFCQREQLAIASQSYAFCTGAGSVVYVLLRELALRDFRLSLMGRVVLSAGTTIGLRAWEYKRGSPLLSPMHGTPKTKAKANIKRMSTIVVE